MSKHSDIELLLQLLILYIVTAQHFKDFESDLISHLYLEGGCVNWHFKPRNLNLL